MQGFDGKISLSRGYKRIQINENGDYIDLQINDATFIRSYAKLYKDIEEIIKNLSNIDFDSKEFDTDKKLELLETQQLLICKKLNNFFNDDICKKAFGTSTPCIEEIFDFLSQLADYINKYSEEKINNINKIQSKYMNKITARKNM